MNSICNLLSLSNDLPHEVRSSRFIEFFEAHLSDSLSVLDSDIRPYALQSALAGGKRIRPLLTLAMAAHLNDISRKPIILAAAVEFIHTATLLHDDVVDESNLRRGKKTANIIWGNEFSVLAGDFLFAQSFELMVETESLEALSSLATASCKITQGEFQQMQIANKPDTSIKDYFDVIGKKTAERLLLELKGKLGADLGQPTGTSHDHANDILQALVALGYSDKEAALALKSLPPDIGVSDGIKMALKALAK